MLGETAERLDWIDTKSRGCGELSCARVRRPFRGPITPVAARMAAALAVGLLLLAGCGDGGDGGGLSEDDVVAAPTVEEFATSSAVGAQDNPATIGQWFSLGEDGQARITAVELTEGTYPIAQVPSLPLASSQQERLEEAGLPLDAQPHLITSEVRFSQAFIDAAADAAAPIPFFVEVAGSTEVDEENERFAEDCPTPEPAADAPESAVDASPEDVFVRYDCRFIAEGEELRLFRQTFDVTHVAAYTLDGVVEAADVDDGSSTVETVLSSDPDDDVLAEAGPSTVAVTGSYSCALDDTGGVYCWGAVPSAEPPTGEFAALESTPAGGMCALSPEGQLACWAGDTPEPDDFTQQGAPPAGVFVQLGRPGCAIAENGEIACWHLRPATITDPSGPHVAVATSGDDVYCAIEASGEIECWASEGNSDDEATQPPSGRFASLAGGAGHFCAVDEDAAVVCWGSGAPDPADLPAGRVASVSVNRDVGCALGTNQRLACWGLDLLQDPPEGEFTSVAVGTFHACAIDTSGEPVCWGEDSQGEATPPPS